MRVDRSLSPKSRFVQGTRKLRLSSRWCENREQEIWLRRCASRDQTQPQNTSKQAEIYLRGLTLVSRFPTMSEIIHSGASAVFEPTAFRAQTSELAQN